MPPTILVPQVWTKAQRTQEAPGRPAGRSHGGWIADLTGLRQCVLLCEFCQAKFNPKAHGYRPWRNTHVQARCDACKAHSTRATAFMATEHYEQVIPKRGRRAL